jgi:chromatin remodeling complex protein RSC6
MPCGVSLNQNNGIQTNRKQSLEAKHGKNLGRSRVMEHMLEQFLRFITIKKFSNLSGYTEKAIQRKIESHIWIEGQQYIRAPDNRTLIDIQGYEKWAAKQQSKSERNQSASDSLGEEKSEQKRSKSVKRRSRQEQGMNAGPSASLMKYLGA